MRRRCRLCGRRAWYFDSRGLLCSEHAADICPYVPVVELDIVEPLAVG